MECMKNKVQVSFTREQLEILQILVKNDISDIFNRYAEEENKILQEIKFGLIKCKGFNK